MTQNIDVIETKLEVLTAQVNKLESKLDVYAQQFIPLNLYELKHRELETKVNELSHNTENRLNVLARARFGQNLQTIIITAIVTAMFYWVIAAAVRGRP